MQVTCFPLFYNVVSHWADMRICCQWLYWGNCWSVLQLTDYCNFLWFAWRFKGYRRKVIYRKEKTLRSVIFHILLFGEFSRVKSSHFNRKSFLWEQKISPCRCWSCSRWLRKFAAFTNKTFLGLKVTYVWSVFHYYKFLHFYIIIILIITFLPAKACLKHERECKCKWSKKYFTQFSSFFFFFVMLFYAIAIPL